jgi:propionate CoA-transferase
MIRDKITTADEAIALIRDRDVVSCSGFVGIGTPEALFAALERRYLASGAPCGSAWCSPRRPATARIVA